MTNDRKPLHEDDFVGNAAPFVLKITLEYPPRETEYNMRHTHHKRESWIRRLLSLTRHGWLSAWARKRP